MTSKPNYNKLIGRVFMWCRNRLFIVYSNWFDQELGRVKKELERRLADDERVYRQFLKTLQCSETQRAFRKICDYVREQGHVRIEVSSANLMSVEAFSPRQIQLLEAAGLLRSRRQLELTLEMQAIGRHVIYAFGPLSPVSASTAPTTVGWIGDAVHSSVRPDDPGLSAG